MMGKNKQIVDDLKQHMDVMFDFASKVAYQKDHLLPVLQASKSLIGMDLNHPPRNLLKWLDNYVKDFTPDFTPPSPSGANSSPETITYAHLGTLIQNKKVIESNIYLTHLLRVADPMHIAEFLLELGAMKSPGSFLFCWGTFRSIQFIGEKNGGALLYHCISKLLEREKDEKNNANLLLEKFVLYCHQFQIRKTEMIRKNKIIPNLEQMIQTIERELHTTPLPFIPINLRSVIRTEGEQGILSYLVTLQIEEISADLILILDSLRSVLKFSDNPKEKILLRIYDKINESECVE